MTLPRHVKRTDLDKGIAHLVINLNKIPEVNTRTNCEGHVWRDTPVWPSKDGWIHFYAEKGKHKALVETIENFCENNKYFSIDFEDRPEEDTYCIDAHFENHVGKDYFHNAKELEEYLNRADKEKKQILDGWNELNKIVVRYIKKNISPNINNLKYRE